MDNNKQWQAISEEDYKQLDKDVATITTDILDIITKEYQPIVIGSVLPFTKVVIHSLMKKCISLMTVHSRICR